MTFDQETIDALSRFDQLPGSAHIKGKTFAALLDAHPRTIARRIVSEEGFPKPLKTAGDTGHLRFKVKDVRAYLDRAGAQR